MCASPLTLLWTLLCVFFFKHTTAINSSSYQQCGHSKTEKCIISMVGSSALGPFSHLEGEKAIKGCSKGRRIKKESCPANKHAMSKKTNDDNTEQCVFTLSVHILWLVFIGINKHNM